MHSGRTRSKKSHCVVDEWPEAHGQPRAGAEPHLMEGSVCVTAVRCPRPYERVPNWLWFGCQDHFFTPGTWRERVAACTVCIWIGRALVVVLLCHPESKHAFIKNHPDRRTCSSPAARTGNKQPMTSVISSAYCSAGCAAEEPIYTGKCVIPPRAG